MMRKPSVFVSSTCYDLKQVREDIRDFIEGLGLTPLVSEHNSFPVNPSVGTVENCLEVVQRNADIFVLIVGNRYGSPTNDGKSVTNLEYLTARSKGIPAFVFVSRSILDILPIWKANPDGDFSAVSDRPGLFRFVEELRDKGTDWVFPFDTAEHIYDILRNQIAYLFMDALSLRLGAGSLSPALRNLPGALLRLVIEKPSFWEFLLFAQAIEHEIKTQIDIRRDWEYDIASGPCTLMTGRLLLRWLSEKGKEASQFGRNADRIINDVLQRAFGAPGESGDADAILYCAKKLSAIYRDALEWKLSFRRVHGPDEFNSAKMLASTFCDNFVLGFEGFSARFNKDLIQGIADAQSGMSVRVNSRFTIANVDLAPYDREMGRLVEMASSGAIDLDSWD